MLTGAGEALAADGIATGKRRAGSRFFAVFNDRCDGIMNHLPQRLRSAQAVIEIGECLPVGAADFVIEAVKVFVNALQFFDLLQIAFK